MNRRSAIKTGMAFLGSLLLPWRRRAVKPKAPAQGRRLDMVWECVGPDRFRIISIERYDEPPCPEPPPTV